MDSILHGLRQPEYVHVCSIRYRLRAPRFLIGLIIAFFLKSRRAQIATLALVFICALSAWPVYEFASRRTIASSP